MFCLGQLESQVARWGYTTCGRAMFTSYRLSIEQCARLANAASFWPVMQAEATVVDSVSARVTLVGNVLDFIGTECRTSVPSGRETDMGTPLYAPAGWRIVSFLTRHSASIFRKRMQKRAIDASAAAGLCECYGYTDVESMQAAASIIEFLARQADYLINDEHRLLLVARETDL